MRRLSMILMIIAIALLTGCWLNVITDPGYMPDQSQGSIAANAEYAIAADVSVAVFVGIIAAPSIVWWMIWRATRKRGKRE